MFAKKIVDIFRFKLIKLQDLSIGLNQKFKNQITESKAQVERMEWIKYLWKKGELRLSATEICGASCCYIPLCLPLFYLSLFRSLLNFNFGHGLANLSLSSRPVSLEA